MPAISLFLKKERWHCTIAVSPLCPQPQIYLVTKGHKVFQSKITLLIHMAFTVFFMYTNSLYRNIKMLGIFYFVF